MSLAPTKVEESKSASQKASEPNRSSGKFKRWMAYAGVVIALQACGILVAEYVLYLAGLGEEEIYAFDRDLGTKHMGNKRITWRSEGFGQTYFNSDGMQEQNLTIAKPAGVYRIAVIGDSMTEGLQVFPPQKFPYKLQERLKAPDGFERLQVLNFGTSGYSTAQEYIKLKKQILPYAPDMVVLCYHSRDIFENWSPPDATMTNLRPVALKLPDHDLVIDNSPVLQWMKSPRGKFLTSIGWVRNHSRVWGLISATETELSFKSEVYKTLVALVTKPRKTVTALWEEYSKPGKIAESIKATEIFSSLFGPKSDGPAFKIQFFEGGNPNEQVQDSQKSTAQKNVDVKRESTVETASSESSDENEAAEESGATNSEEKLTGAQSMESTKTAKPEDNNFIKLLKNTLAALILEMNSVTTAANAKLVVVSLPSRVALATYPGQDPSSMGLFYDDEIAFVASQCEAAGIPFYNANEPAKSMKMRKRKGLFYALHLTPEGHEYTASQLAPFIQSQLSR